MSDQRTEAFILREQERYMRQALAAYKPRKLEQALRGTVNAILEETRAPHPLTEEWFLVFFGGVLSMQDHHGAGLSDVLAAMHRREWRPMLDQAMKKLTENYHA